jgi:ABC-type amino acid transport substrate-binding protein
MMLKICAAGLCAAFVAVTALSVTPAEAQTRKRVANNDRPRARVTVAPRSFLDAGTEVRPGERKFTDYAFPPGYMSATGTVTNIGGKVGWDRSPMMQPFQLPGFTPW